MTALTARTPYVPVTTASTAIIYCATCHEDGCIAVAIHEPCGLWVCDTCLRFEHEYAGDCPAKKED